MWFTTSWDDGHPLDSKLADLLTRHGIAGTFYWPIHNREGLPVLDAGAMRALDGAFEVGSHTLDHAYADAMPAPEWKAQVVQGKRQLEQIVGHTVAGFCYPGGKLTPAARATVAAAGFSHGRTTENLRDDCGADPLLMPTSLQFYPHPRQVLLRNFVRHGRWGRRGGLAAQCLTAPNFEARLRDALALCRSRGAIFHLWGHSWEIDRHGLWQQLDRFLAHVADTVPHRARVDNGGLLRACGLLP